MDDQKVKPDEDRVFADFMFLPQHLKSSPVDKPAISGEKKEDDG